MSRRRNDEARDRIVQTAYAMFADGGFEAVSMERVAKRAGLKKANLFHYYPTKEALGVAVLQRAERRAIDDLKTIFSASLHDPLQAVESLFEIGSWDSREECGRSCFIGRMAQDVDSCNADLRRRVASCMTAWRDLIREFLEDWRGRGYFGTDFSAVEAADAVLALYEGGIIVSRAIGTAGPARHARRVARRFIISSRG